MTFNHGNSLPLSSLSHYAIYLYKVQTCLLLDVNYALERWNMPSSADDAAQHSSLLLWLLLACFDTLQLNMLSCVVDLLSMGTQAVLCDTIITLERILRSRHINIYIDKNLYMR